MRTTITLDPDVAALVSQEMKARNVGFKEAVNSALRRQLSRTDDRPPLRHPTRDLGAATVDLVHANQLAVALEDDELIRKLESGR